MRHPPTVWVDQAYAEEPLDRLRRDNVDYLRGRAPPTSPDTLIEYNSSLLAFIRSLERQGEKQVLGTVTPGAVSAWVNEQRSIDRSEDSIASRLGAVRVFSSRYIDKHLELTTRDLLMKVSRLTPPEKQMLGHSTNVMTRRYLGRPRQAEAARQIPNDAPI